MGGEVEIQKVKFVPGGAGFRGDDALSGIVHRRRAPEGGLQLSRLKKQRTSVIALNVGLVAGSDSLDLCLQPNGKELGKTAAD
jgi:hypothetical protein